MKKGFDACAWRAGGPRAETPPAIIRGFKPASNRSSNVTAMDWNSSHVHLRILRRTGSWRRAFKKLRSSMVSAIPDAQDFEKDYQTCPDFVKIFTA